jgi:8-oxo-dGTP pyrophosphatase MutT (NUDIX family)
VNGSYCDYAQGLGDLKFETGRDRDMSTNEIRPAATLILMRDRRPGGPFEVFFTKRPETMVFLPGYYVYPGGAVEPEDEEAAFAQRCTSSAGEPLLAQRIAAIRECFEEIGVLLARDVHGNWVDAQACEVLWKQIQQGTESFHRQVMRNGWTLATDVLQDLGVRVTPKNPTNRRFETRFFMTRFPYGQVPRLNEREVGEGVWLTPAEALQAHGRDGMKLALPTLDSLHYLSGYMTADEAMAGAKGHSPFRR